MKNFKANQNVYLNEGDKKDTDDVLLLKWDLPDEQTYYCKRNMSENRYIIETSTNIEDIVLSTENNLEETKKDTFIESMIQHLEERLAKLENKKHIVVQIHRRGDFYSIDYMIKWIYIAENFKSNNKIVFEAYIKSLPIITDYINEYCRNYGDDLKPQEIIDDINISFKYDLSI